MTTRNRAPPTGLITLAVLLALGAVGIAYGFWSGTLTIVGTVDTGAVDGRWGTAICQEFHTWPRLPAGPGDLGEAEGKEVGSVSATIDEANPGLLRVLVENGYPSYAADCAVEYVNEGSVPWVIAGIAVEPASANLTNCVLSGRQAKTLSCNELTVVFVDGIGSEIFPGDLVASSLRVHVEQAAQQGTEYGFMVAVCVDPANGQPAPGDCGSSSR